MAESTPERNKGVGGRPTKFNEPSRPITVTLPDRILDRLRTIDADRAHAIVRCIEAMDGDRKHPEDDVQLVEVLDGKALITVGQCRALHRISWLRLVEISPGRSLLVLPSGTPVDSLEVAIMDLIDELGPDEKRERAILVELRGLIGTQRRKKKVTKAEFVFVDI